MSTNIENQSKKLRVLQVFLTLSVVGLAAASYTSFLNLQKIQDHESTIQKLNTDLSGKVDLINVLNKKVATHEAAIQTLENDYEKSLALISELHKGSTIDQYDPTLNKALLSSDIAKISYMSASTFKDQFSRQGYELDIVAFKIGLQDAEQNKEPMVSQSEYLDALMREQQKQKNE